MSRPTTGRAITVLGCAERSAIYERPVPMAIELSALELCEKSAAIIPFPYINQTIYHGVLAGNSAWRKEVVPKPPPETPTEVERRLTRTLQRGACVPSLRATWAELLARVSGVDGWACPSCGYEMKLRATLDGAPITTHVLRSLARRGPPSGGEAKTPGLDGGAARERANR